MSSVKRLFWLALSVVCAAVVAFVWRTRGQATSSARPALPAVGPMQYVNVAREAGITFRHDDGRKGISTMMEQAGPGCALLDYDGDGWLDLYLLNGRDLYGRGIRQQNALYRNNRDGTFTDVTDVVRVPGTGYGLGVAVGDFDNDGHPDIYLCQYGKNVLYRNTRTSSTVITAMEPSPM